MGFLTEKRLQESIGATAERYLPEYVLVNALADAALEQDYV